MFYACLREKDARLGAGIACRLSGNRILQNVIALVIKDDKETYSKRNKNDK